MMKVVPTMPMRMIGNTQIHGGTRDNMNKSATPNINT